MFETSVKEPLLEWCHPEPEHCRIGWRVPFLVALRTNITPGTRLLQGGQKEGGRNMRGRASTLEQFAK